MEPRPNGHDDAPPQYSPDGRWWWDGRRWLPVGQAFTAPRPPGMGTGVKLALLSSGAVVGLAVLVGAALAVAVLAPRLTSRTGPGSQASRVVFDDDFTTDQGWDVRPLEGFATDRHLGHPGAIHMAVAKKDAEFRELYPGASYARVRFTATMANKTGSGDVGLICADPDSDARYRFWAGSDGTALIEFVRGAGAKSTSLGEAHGGQWGQGETHTLAAVCSSDGAHVSLELLVDGKSVLQASDTAFKGPYRAGVLVLGPVDLELRHFTVTTF